MALKSLLTFLLIPIFFLDLSAQKADEASLIKAEFWNNKSPKYLNKTAPEKWKGESAVILFQRLGYDYSKHAVWNKLTATSYYHSRVLLQDKAAVKEFSEFSFSTTFSNSVGYQRLKGKSNVGFKIIKPDGTEREVDLNNAVEVEGNSSRDQVKKIAIPDLQVGDILDYYYNVEERFNIIQMHAFDPVITTLNQTYPMVHQEVEFNVERNFYIYFQSLNGAPELKDVSKGNRLIYSLASNDIPKNENKNWYYPYRSAPTIKFQVIYSKTPYFFSTSTPQDYDKPKNKLSKDEVVAIYRSLGVSYLHYKPLRKYMKNKGLDGLGTEEAVQEAYRWLYHQLLGSKIEGMYLGKLNISNSASRNVLKELAYYCSKNDIKYNWVVTAAREYSELEDILLVGEMNPLLRISVEGKEIYFNDQGLYPHYGEIPSAYEGAQAYVIASELPSWAKTTSADLIRLPSSSSEDNKSVNVSSISFNPKNMASLSFESRYDLAGHTRTWDQNSLLDPYDYLEEEYQHFGDKLYLEDTKGTRNAAIAQQKVSNLKEELAKYRKDKLQSDIEHDFDNEIENIRDFKVHKTGRLLEEIFAYSYKFDVKGLVSKAGPNYIVQIGNVIGSQVEITEKGMTRTADIYMPYARSFENEITLTIPNGYSIEGIENLNKNVTNETGGFVSTATLKKNQLVINTKKYYNHNFEPAKNWDKMLEFLEAAYQFTQEKVLMKIVK